jgi:hypothetical protein
VRGGPAPAAPGAQTGGSGCWGSLGLRSEVACNKVSNIMGVLEEVCLEDIC